MATFYINGSTNNSNWNFRLKVEELQVGTGEHDNQTQVKFTVQTGRKTYYEGAYIAGTGAFIISGDIDVNENKYVYISAPMTAGTYYDIYDYTIWVYHETDGTRTLSLSCYWGMPPEVSPNNSSASGTITLTPIPRANKVTNISNSYVDYKPRFTIKKSSSSFTTTLKYKLPSQSSYTTIVNKFAGDYYDSYTFPPSLYSLIPGKYVDNVTLQVITYNGNTVITTETQSFRIDIVERDAKPSIGSYTILDTNSVTKTYTDLDTTMVRYVSIPRLTISNLTTQVGATWTTVTFKDSVTTVTKKYADVTDKANFTMDMPTYSYGSFTITVTDTRGYNTTYESVSGTNFQEIPYVKPTINAVNVKRTAPTEDQITVGKLSGNWYNGSIDGTPNTVVLQFRYKEKDASSMSAYYTLPLTMPSGNSYSFSNVLLNINDAISFDYTKSYVIDFRIGDLLVANWQTGVIVTKGIPIANWDKTHFNVNGSLTINETPLIQEGTWTPYFGCVNEDDPYVTFTTRRGYYKKIGNLVYVSFYTRGKITALNGTNNYARVYGLPFEATNAGSFGSQSLDTGISYAVLNYSSNAKTIVYGWMLRLQSDDGSSALSWKVTTTNYFELAASGWYYVA